MLSTAVEFGKIDKSSLSYEYIIILSNYGKF